MTAKGMWRSSTSHDKFDQISHHDRRERERLRIDRMEKSGALKSINENSALIRVEWKDWKRNKYPKLHEITWRDGSEVENSDIIEQKLEN